MLLSNLTVVLIGILGLALMIVLKILTDRFEFIRRAYLRGIALWAHWLPVLAALGFIFIIGANVSNDPMLPRQYFRLDMFFESFELLILFVLSPLLFTRAGNIVAAASALYCIERIILSNSPAEPNLGVILILSCSIIISLIGDKMPWHLRSKYQSSLDRLREIAVLILCFAALSFIFASILNLKAFSRWLLIYYKLNLGQDIAIVSLVVLFLGWIAVAIGTNRRLSLPFLCILTMFPIAFVSHWSGYVLLVPFVATVSLSLASIDHRARTGY
jgi:hypothetical protein